MTVMSTKRKPVIREHSIPCAQEDAIDHLTENSNKLSILITGNGNPEKGLCRQVAIIKERQDGVLTKLVEIHDSVTLFHSKFEEAKWIAVTVQSAFEKYKAECEGEEKGLSKSSSRKQVNFNNIISIVGTIVIVVGLIITLLQVTKNNKQITTNTQKIENLRTPVIVDSRGAKTPLPKGDSLTYYGNDGFKNFKDTVK